MVNAHREVRDQAAEPRSTSISSHGMCWNREGGSSHSSGKDRQTVCDELLAQESIFLNTLTGLPGTTKKYPASPPRGPVPSSLDPSTLHQMLSFEE